MNERDAALQYLAHEADEDVAKAIDPMGQKYTCMHCLLEGRPHLKQPIEFGVERPAQLLRKVFMDGAWA